MEIDSYFKLILVIGALLSVLLSIFLSFSPHNKLTNRILAVLIFFWAFTVLNFAVQSREFFINYPHLFGIGTGLILLFFPLIYIYIRSYLFGKQENRLIYLVHLIPFLLYLIIFAPFYLQSAEIKSQAIQEGSLGVVRPLLKLTDIVLILQGILYTALSLRVLQKFQYFGGKKLTKIQLLGVKWLRQFLILNILLWAVGASGALLELMGLEVKFDLFKVYYLGLTVLTIWLGYFTIRKPFLFSLGQRFSNLPPSKKGIKKNESGKLLDKNETEEVLRYIRDEKPYLNNDIKLQDISDRTGLSKHRISELLNNELNKSFYDIINEHRTNEAIRLIREGHHKDHTLIYLAERAGFNSKATFNRIFKEFTGMTPSDFIRSVE